MTGDEVSYHLLKRRNLNRRQRTAITKLKVSSMLADFPDGKGRIESERDYFIANSDKSLVKPNGFMGRPFSNRRQAYANALSLLAVQYGEPIVHLPIADNASSRSESRLKKEIEIQTKLHIDAFRGRDIVTHRFVWLGYAALGRNVRDQIASDPNRFTPLDKLLTLGLQTRNHDQPVAAYPWGEEIAWRAALGSIGLEAQVGQSGISFSFGPEQEIQHDRFLAESVTFVQSKIMSKDGAQ